MRAFTVSRVRKAVSLTVGFFGGSSVAIGSVPVVYWLLQRFTSNKEAIKLRNVEVLFTAYAVVILPVLIHKFLKAGKLVRRDEERKAMVKRLVGSMSPEHREALRQLLIYGKVTEYEVKLHLAAKGFAYNPEQAVFPQIRSLTRFLIYDSTTTCYEIKPALVDLIEEALE